jgi:hypothetical protein
LNLSLIPVEPIVFERSEAFVDGPGYHALQEILTPVYPCNGYGSLLRAARLDRRISIRAAAERLGISCAQLSGLEFGKFTLSQTEWREVLETIRQTVGTLGTAHGGAR